MMPQSWNNGIVGFSKDVIQFQFYGQDHRAFHPTLRCPKTHFSKIPTFQLGEAPNLSSHTVTINQ
ncbi:hypothetical protein D1AOALGA4SA_3329 [Olavius algarvensis Delta 1 endosymbiont]|nr:hypothetical protein D1AOALGA4SA_3329 [Olavius algarvensis Delta 1 endosymbiont]